MSDVSKIDAAIADAKARKAARKSSDSETGEKKTKLSAEEKAARDQAKEQERSAKKAEREAARAAKRAEREQGRKPAHMSKVEKAAARLPSLAQAAQEAFNSATVNLSADQVSALAAHLSHFNRVRATERALGQKVEAGDSVRIVGGEARFVGKTGTVSKAQRIRCYVEIEGFKKPVYLFTSDVEKVVAAARTGTAG